MVGCLRDANFCWIGSLINNRAQTDERQALLVLSRHRPSFAEMLLSAAKTRGWFTGPRNEWSVLLLCRALSLVVENSTKSSTFP